jgi:hypothetical protein
MQTPRSTDSAIQNVKSNEPVIDYTPRIKILYHKDCANTFTNQWNAHDP